MWFYRTQLLDFAISFQLFVMMALTTLGPVLPLSLPCRAERRYPIVCCSGAPRDVCHGIPFVARSRALGIATLQGAATASSVAPAAVRRGRRLPPTGRPEDEDKAVDQRTRRWLWPQRAVSCSVITAFMLRRHNAHLDNAVNIPMAVALLLLWCAHHYGALSNRLPDKQEGLQVARNTLGALFGLGIYLYIQEQIGPYWFWHSFWHLLCSLGSRSILVAKEANARSAKAPGLISA